MSGRGNPNPRGSKPDKLMRDALIVALKREAIDADGQPTTKLTKIAEKLVDLALGDDSQAIQAIKEINDRVDGKAPQTIGGDADAPLAISLIEMVPVAPKHEPED